MFDKMTERSRKVMSLARQEAGHLNSEFIGSEHILLGIIQEAGGVAAKVLKNLDVSLKRVRQEIEKLVTPSKYPAKTMGQLPFSPRCKRVIELAEEEAGKLGQDVIGTEHLLLGLVMEKEGVAYQILFNLGLKSDEVRNMVLEVIGAGTKAPVDAQFIVTNSSSSLAIGSHGVTLNLAPKENRTLFISGDLNGPILCPECGVQAMMDVSIYSTFKGEAPEKKIGRKCMWCGLKLPAVQGKEGEGRK